MGTINRIDNPSARLIGALPAFFSPKTELRIFSSKIFLQKGLDGNIGFGHKVTRTFFIHFQVFNIFKVSQAIEPASRITFSRTSSEIDIY